MIFQFLDTYEILQDVCSFKITLRINNLQSSSSFDVTDDNDRQPHQWISNMISSMPLSLRVPSAETEKPSVHLLHK